MKTITCTFLVPEERIPELEKLLRQFEPVRDDQITLAQACREFGVSTSTMDRWVNQMNLVPFVQPVPGGKKFVKRSDIQALLTAKEEKKVKQKRRKTVLNMRRTR